MTFPSKVLGDHPSPQLLAMMLLQHLQVKALCLQLLAMVLLQHLQVIALCLLVRGVAVQLLPLRCSTYFYWG